MSDLDPDVLEVKVVIRCRDYQASLHFYRDVLGLAVREQWDEPGDAGCVLSPDLGGSAGSIEVYAMTEQDPRYDPAYSRPLTNDKIDVQLRTSSLDPWVSRLQGKCAFSEPETTSWGHRWIKLRDPDDLLVAIYEVLPPGGPANDRQQGPREEADGAKGDSGRTQLLRSSQVPPSPGA